MPGAASSDTRRRGRSRPIGTPQSWQPTRRPLFGKTLLFADHTGWDRGAAEASPARDGARPPKCPAASPLGLRLLRPEPDRSYTTGTGIPRRVWCPRLARAQRRQSRWHGRRRGPSKPLPPADMLRDAPHRHQRSVAHQTVRDERPSPRRLGSGRYGGSSEHSREGGGAGLKRHQRIEAGAGRGEWTGQKHPESRRREVERRLSGSFSIPPRETARIDAFPA